VPGKVELQESVAFPEFSMMLGLIAAQEVLDGASKESVTGPVNPLKGVIVIVDTACFPVSTGAGEMVVIVKSPSRRAKVIETVVV